MQLNIMISAKDFQRESSGSKPYLSEHDEVDPIEINSTIMGSMKKAGKWEIKISAQVKLNVRTDKNVIISSQLFELSDDRNSLSLIQENSKVFEKPLKFEESIVISDKLEPLNKGQYKLIYQATSKQDEHNTYGGNQELLFTVGENSVQKGWVANPAPYPGPQNNSDYAQQNLDYECHSSENRPRRSIKDQSNSTVQSSRMNTDIIEASEVILNGEWRFLNREKQVRPVRDAKVEVWYYSLNECKWKNPVNTFTDDQGKFTASYNKVTDAFKWELKLLFENNYASVQSGTGIVWSHEHYEKDLSIGEDLEPTLIEPESIAEKAAWLYDDIVRSYAFLLGSKTPGNQAVVVWTPGEIRKSNAVFSLTKNKVYVNDRAVNSPNSTIHELGHFYMYDLYGNWFPPSFCNSPGRHVYNGTTEPGCAWIEGWAHFLSLAVNGSSMYRYSNGSIWDAEHTKDYDHNGDHVEGRVTGALWDLYDSAIDGLDTKQYSFEQIYRTMYKDRLNNFEAYWNKWKELGFDKSASDCLLQNEIKYSQHNKLPVWPPTKVTGPKSAVFEVKGQGGMGTIKTSMYSQKTDTWLELFADEELTKRLVFDDDSAGNGYSQLNYLMETNKSYFVKLTNYEEGKPVYAEVTFSSLPSDSSFNLEISPFAPGFVNGQKEMIFKIVGSGEKVTIDTSRLDIRSDTYLEVYSDSELKKLMVQDDDSAGDLYASVSIYLEYGKTYYVKVRNYFNGNPVYAKVSVKL